MNIEYLNFFFLIIYALNDARIILQFMQWIVFEGRTTNLKIHDEYSYPFRFSF